MTSPARPAAAPDPAVVAPDERSWDRLPADAGRMSIRIDLEGVGAPNLVQRLVELEPGGVLVERHEDSEDVVYVASGAGTAMYDGHTVGLRPGLGFLVPAGVERTIRSDEGLRLVSVLAPPPGRPGALAPASEASEEARPWVHESEEEVISAGDDEARNYMDRYFKLMIDPRHGAHYVTQFIGFIERSKAPAHTHTYDEVIYILDGDGLVHIGDGSHHISAGHSVYLPPGSVHCLENQGDVPLALLGVFCPAGSPRARERA